jgi:predicted MPP superfamily phosphohydrolase
MKKILFILFVFLSLFSSCTEENATVDETTNETNKVLLLKVDYLTNTFQGGKETTYTENSNSFTI